MRTVIVMAVLLLLPGGWARTLANQRPLIIAHRGARSLAPENTLAAARVAWRLGADGWEFDVRITRDGHLILMHDETLSHTTNASAIFPDRSPWLVNDFTLSEIKMLDAGSWFVEQDPYGTITAGEVSPEEAESFRSEKVPTLEEAIALSKELGLWVNIELKTRPSCGFSPQAEALADGTIATIRKYGMETNVLISSFDPEIMRYLAIITPDIPKALLVSSLFSLPTDFISYLKTLGVEALNPRYDLVTEEILEALRKAGFKVYIWTVNELSQLKLFSSDRRITGIITDWPQRPLAILGRQR